MSWADEELGAVNFGDERLHRRSRKVLERLAEQPMFSIPSACNGWAEIQAAYRFFDNEKVSADKVLSAHEGATIERMREQSLVLCIQDTSELDYTSHAQTNGLGPLTYHERRGLYLHPTLAVSPERLCLGVIHHHMWTRDDAKHGKKTRTCTQSKAIEDKESQRWVDGYRAMCKVAEKIPATKLMSVADREADFYEMFYEAAEANNAVELLIRSRCDRVLEDGGKLRARVAEQHQGLSRKLRGHFAYYGITGNGRALSRFREPVVETWFKWLNRRGEQRRWTWERYARVLRVVPLPEAIVVHSVWRHAARP
jgi:hypothetical protein